MAFGSSIPMVFILETGAFQLILVIQICFIADLPIAIRLNLPQTQILLSLFGIILHPAMMIVRFIQKSQNAMPQLHLDVDGQKKSQALGQSAFL